MALYEKIAKLSLPQRRTHLAALLTTSNPSTDQKHEIDALTAATRRGWSPQLQYERDQRAQARAEKKASPAEPTPKPIVAPKPPEPVVKEVHIHTKPAPPSNPKPVPPATGPSRPSGGPMSESPRKPSGITINTGDFVASIGALLLAAGIIGFMLWHFGAVEFLNIVLFIFLPVAALLSAVGLMKWATMKMLYNFELKSRVATYLEQMRNEATRYENEFRSNEREHATS